MSDLVIKGESVIVDVVTWNVGKFNAKKIQDFLDIVLNNLSENNEKHIIALCFQEVHSSDVDSFKTFIDERTGQKPTSMVNSIFNGFKTNSPGPTKIFGQYNTIYSSCFSRRLMQFTLLTCILYKGVSCSDTCKKCIGIQKDDNKESEFLYNTGFYSKGYNDINLKINNTTNLVIRNVHIPLVKNTKFYLDSLVKTFPNPNNTNCKNQSNTVCVPNVYQYMNNFYNTFILLYNYHYL